MAKINGGRIIAKALKKEGIDVVFTLCGDHIMEIYYGCCDEGIELIDCRSENIAALAAEGYARASGKPGVVVTTAGPGTSNAITAILEAKGNCSPVVCIGGGSPISTDETGDFQQMPNLEIMKIAAKYSKVAYTTARIPDYIASAFRHATSPLPGPAYVEVPYDILMDVVEEDNLLFRNHTRTEYVAFGDPDAVEEAAEMLVQAKRPVICIGPQSRYYMKHGDSVAELVDYLKIPVATQTSSKGLFADDDNELFTLGMVALPQADVIVILNGLNDYFFFKTQPPMFNGEAKRIQINPDPTQIGFNSDADVGIVGGAGPVAKQLLDAVKLKVDKKTDMTYIQELIDSGQAQGEMLQAMVMREGEERIHPGRLALEITNYISTDAAAKDWTLIVDGGDCGAWVQTFVKGFRPAQVLTTGIDGCVGIGPGTALGAYYANKKPVLLFTGDGSFGYHAMEFDTFVRRGIPVIAVISNDSCWGMIKGMEQCMDKERISSYEQEHRNNLGVNLAPGRRYDKLAEVFECYGKNIESIEDLIPAIQEAYASGQPAIINVMVDDIANDVASFGTQMLAGDFVAFKKQ